MSVVLVAGLNDLVVVVVFFLGLYLLLAATRVLLVTCFHVSLLQHPVRVAVVLRVASMTKTAMRLMIVGVVAPVMMIPKP